jgi:AraC family transcriptional regulator of arabinose operon
MAAIEHLFTSLQVRVLTAHRSVLGPEWRVDEHQLPCNKIYMVYKGNGGYALEGVRHMLRPGDICFQPAKRRCETWHDPKDCFDKIWIHFDARVLGLVDLFDVIACPPPLRLTEDSSTRVLVEELVREHHRKSEYGPLAQNGLLLQILAQVLRQSAQAVPSEEVTLRGPGDRVGKVLQHLAEHFAEPLTLQDLARLVRLHPTYFSNSFRKATGLAPMTFLQRFRVERAKGILATTDLAVMEVAQRVGFADPYHFSRVFKKLTGSSPREFQQSVRRPGPH